MKQDNVSIPTLAKIWLRLYHAVPKIQLPGSSIDWGFCISCTLAFFLARLCLQQILTRCFGWPAATIVTKNAAACLTGGIFHTPNLVPVSFVLMRSVRTYDPAGSAKDQPQWWQDVADAVIQLCTAHMLCDTIVGSFLDRWEPGRGLVMDSDAWLFLAHHIISLLYLVSTRILQAGHQSMLMCFLLGETSNPPFCAYLVCQMAITLECCSGPVAMKVVALVEVINAIVYIPFRAIIGPIVGTHMTYLLLSTKSTLVPMPIRMMWTLILWGIAIASIPFVFQFADDFTRHVGIKYRALQREEF